MPTPQMPDQNPTRVSPAQPDTPSEEPLRQNPQKEEQAPKAYGKAHPKTPNDSCGC
jgi:hypothetical protein